MTLAWEIPWYCEGLNWLARKGAMDWEKNLSSGVCADEEACNSVGYSLRHR